MKNKQRSAADAALAQIDLLFVEAVPQFLGNATFTWAEGAKSMVMSVDRKGAITISVDNDQADEGFGRHDQFTVPANGYIPVDRIKWVLEQDEED